MVLMDLAISCEFIKTDHKKAKANAGPSVACFARLRAPISGSPR